MNGNKIIVHTLIKSNEKYLNEFKGLNEIFKEFNIGIKTEKDSLAIQLTKEKLENILNDFRNLSEKEMFDKYNIKATRDWKVNKAQKNIIENKGNIEIVHYRPFDFRYTYYSENQGIVVYSRYNIMKHILHEKNIAINFKRQIGKDRDFSDAFVVDKIVESCLFESANANNVVAPLYLYEENSAGEFKLDSSCKPNWTDSFKEFLKNYISDNPKEILNYIYAILYSPTYRENYKEDLKYDYPRIPFTKDKNIFDRLQILGGDLIDLHLLKKVPQSNAGYPNKGEHKISYSKYNEVEKRLYINEKQYFENVKKEVYNYSIGGYKPIEKYIKAREILTLKDISHLIKVIAVIERTIYLQEEIDKVWREADF